MSSLPPNESAAHEREEVIPLRAASTESLRVEGDGHEVRQLGLVAAILSLGYVFWVVGAMEMVERLAYYGVKAVATQYAKAPASEGGLGVSMSVFASLLSTWALTQSLVPVFTGGLSDRYGYKQTIFVSTCIKIAGYLTMAAFPTYNGFFVGAILLALGTAVFKPGIQGTLVNATTRENSSMAWGIFYQTVNIGGFLGPLVAGYMRKMAWSNVFLACAAIICCNFLLLLTYREPGIERRLERRERERAEGRKGPSLLQESLAELFQPKVFVYLAIFSGFWFMFNALFDVLPAYIEDWVDTRDIVATLFGTGGAQSEAVKFFIVMSKDGKHIMPEGMLNLNAGLIMTTCFLFAWISGRMRATTSMVIGTLMASAAMFLSGWSTLGWVSVAAIGIFSVGEMLSSPKFSEFIGNFAPADKKAMYLGFSQISLAVGWTLEGSLGPRLYDYYSSKDLFSREMLGQLGFSVDQIGLIPSGQAFNFLVRVTGEAPDVLTRTLRDSHAPGMVWYIMGGIGLLAALGIFLYGMWIHASRKPAAD